MNVIAFLFVVIGAFLNMFQSDFTSSMYGALKAVIKSGLPGEGITVLAILIFAVLCLIPVVSVIMGLFALFRRSKSSGVILFLCAIADSLAAWGIYYVSSESFASSFLANYVVPYAQKVSFITPAIWAACYLVAGVLILFKREKVIDPSKDVSGPSIVFGLGWTDKKGKICDLDASAFLFAANGKILDVRQGIIGFKVRIHESGKVWSTGDIKKGDIIKYRENSRDDLEQIIVNDLKEIPSKIYKIVFVVTVNGTASFGDTQSAYVRLVDEVIVDEAHIVDKTLVIGKTNGVELKEACYDLKNKKFSGTNALVVAEIHRDGKSWSYNAIGEAMIGGFDAVCESFGINVRR